MKRSATLLALAALLAWAGSAAAATHHPRHPSPGRSRAHGAPGTAAKAPADSVQQIWMTARDLATGGQHDSALVVLGEGLRQHPGSTDLLWLEAAVYGWSGNHREAVARYERLLADHPELARDVRMDLATERLWADDPLGAIRDLDLRIAEEPTDRDARSMRALALSHAGRLKESLAAYSQLVSEDPSDLDAALERARVLGWMGRHREAVAAYRDVLARDPSRDAARFGIAQNENWAGHHRAAVAIYDSLRAVPQADPEAEKGLAFAHYWSGHPARAQQALDRYLALKPTDLEALDLADKIARERKAGFTARYGRADDTDELRVESRTLDVRLPLPGETSLLLSWRRLGVHDPGGSFDPFVVGAGLERTWGDLWIARGHVDYYKRNDATDGLGLGEAAVTWKPADPVRLDAGVAKQVVETRLSVERGITMRTLVGGVDWNINDGVMLHAEGHARDYSDDNHATQLAAAARARVHAERTLRAFVTGNVEQLRTDKDLDDGYYDPRRYTEGGPGAALEWEPKRGWSIGAEGQTGWQQEQGAETKPFYNYQASVEFVLGRFVVLQLEGGRSNSNLTVANGYAQRRWGISLARSF